MNRALGIAVGVAFMVLGGTAGAQDAPASVLVQTQTPHRGAFEPIITAYGTAIRSVSGGMTISVPGEGRVLRIDVAPGDAVRAGQVLLEFGLSAAATSSHAQAVSALAVARQDKARVTRLLEQQLATADQVARADKAVSDAQAALAALEAEGAALPRQSVRAPFDGVVDAVLAGQGDRLPPGAPLLAVARGRGLVVGIGVEPSERARLRTGQTVSLEPLTQNEPALRGTLARIGHVLNPKTHLIDAEVAVSGELLLGEAFRARIHVAKVDGWLVPRDAVLGDESGDYLFQAADGKAVRVPVKRLAGDDDESVVDGPVDPGHPIVTAGNYQLQDGAALRQDVPATGEKPPVPRPGAPEKSGR